MIFVNRLVNELNDVCRVNQSVLMLWLLFLSSPQHANEFIDNTNPGTVNLGVELSSVELESLPRHVFPDGSGLPDGSGTGAAGASLYAEHCANCHGSAGQGGKALELVGDASLLATDYPDRGIGVFWSYAPTLYEYINRSMPPATPGIFSVDELYSIIAHLLELNELIEPGSVLDKASLSDVQLPNRHGFTTIAR